MGQADNGYVVTGARAASFGANDPRAGASTITLSTHQGWQEVEYFVNQTNLHLDRVLGEGSSTSSSSAWSIRITAC